MIQSSYHGAAGALLMDQKKYEEAIAQLEEDQDNPFTLELLVQAYYQTEQVDKLHEVEAKLRGTNVPTMEQALVVPAARAERPDNLAHILTRSLQSQFGFRVVAQAAGTPSSKFAGLV